MPGWATEIGSKINLHLSSSVEEEVETEGRSFHPQAIKEVLLATEKIWIEHGGKEFNDVHRFHLMDEVGAVMMNVGKVR